MKKKLLTAAVTTMFTVSTFASTGNYSSVDPATVKFSKVDTRSYSVTTAEVVDKDGQVICKSNLSQHPELAPTNLTNSIAVTNKNENSTQQDCLSLNQGEFLNQMAMKTTLDSRQAFLGYVVVGAICVGFAAAGYNNMKNKPDPYYGYSVLDSVANSSQYFAVGAVPGFAYGTFAAVQLIRSSPGIFLTLGFPFLGMTILGATGLSGGLTAVCGIAGEATERFVRYTFKKK